MAACLKADGIDGTVNFRHAQDGLDLVAQRYIGGQVCNFKAHALGVFEADGIDVPDDDDATLTAPPADSERLNVANALSSTTFTPIPIPAALSPDAFAPADVTVEPTCVALAENAPPIVVRPPVPKRATVASLIIAIPAEIPTPVPDVPAPPLNAFVVAV